MLEDVGEARVGIARRRVGSGHEFVFRAAAYVDLGGIVCPGGRDDLDFLWLAGAHGALDGLGARDIEMLHGQAPCLARLLKAGDDAAPPRPGREERAGALGIADGGG